MPPSNPGYPAMVVPAKISPNALMPCLPRSGVVEDPSAQHGMLLLGLHEARTWAGFTRRIPEVIVTFANSLGVPRLRRSREWKVVCFGGGPLTGEVPKVTRVATLKVWRCGGVAIGWTKR